ncbi:MAG: SusD/RagB family nutrient-binding outer membrane lipoprotein [bacterium]
MRFTRLSVGVLGLAAISACKTDLTALNEDPNSPKLAPAGPLFTSATRSAIATFQNSANTLSMTELFAQQIAQIQYIDEDRGHIRPANIDGMFNALYGGPLQDLQKLILVADSTKQPNASAPAKVLESWIFQNMTDLWGDIPYTAALKGGPGGDFQPKYDTQKDVYYGLLKTLTDAAVALKIQPTLNDPSLGNADPLYNGDNAQWIKFDNALRARLAMRMSKADPAKANAELTAAFAGGMFTSNSDNAKVLWPGDGIYDNPWASNFAGRDDHRMAKTFIDTLKALSDPRLPIFAQPTNDDPTVYAGMQNGLDNTYTARFFNTTSRPGAIFYPGATVYGNFGSSAGKALPSYILTFAEVSFIQAEAAERSLGGLTPAAAAGFYNAGVTASITQWGGSAADAAAYLASPGVAYVPGASGLKQIGLQKWIALFTQGTEAWSEWRRTGNPASIVAGPRMYSDAQGVARRLLYPPAEQSNNGASLTAAIADQGPDAISTRVWWDK